MYNESILTMSSEAVLSHILMHDIPCQKNGVPMSYEPAALAVKDVKIHRS